MTNTTHVEPSFLLLHGASTNASTIRKFRLLNKLPYVRSTGTGTRQLMTAEGVDVDCQADHVAAVNLIDNVRAFLRSFSLCNGGLPRYART